MGWVLDRRGFPLSLATATILFSTLAVPADDDKTYDLRGPAPEKGQIYRTKSVLAIKDADVTLKIAGQTLEFKQTQTVTNEEEERILAVDGRQPVKSQAKIIKDEIDSIVDIDGEKKTENKPGELQGEVIVSERLKDGKWKHTLVDSTATAKQKQELEKRIGPENDDDLFPAEKVKVGHEWTVDAALMRKFFGNSVTDLKGKLKQKFVRVEETNGELCAVIVTTGPMTGKMKDEDGKLDMELDLKSTAWRSLKTGIEVKNVYTGKIKLSGKQKIDDEKADVTTIGKFEGNSTTELKN